MTLTAQRAPLRLLALCFLASTFSGRGDVSGAFKISEIMAVADVAFPDDDGQPSDWIEITNTGASPLSLNGYHLTNNAANLTRWSFPDVSVPAGSSLVVFASGKDRVHPGAPLHTNFTLDRGGDYLGLIEPDGTTVAFEFAPGYPEQYEGISWGEGVTGAPQTNELVPFGAAGKYFIPADGSLGDTWKAAPASFDDSSWSGGPAGFGYESAGGTLEPLISTNISSVMKNVNASGYFRFPFVFDTTDKSILEMQFTAMTDDGFVAYLNGVEIGDFGKPDPLTWESISSGKRLDTVVIANPIVIDVTAFSGALVDGANVLAVHGLNEAKRSSDFALDVRLAASVLDTSGGLQLGFFETPTPGAPNNTIKAAPPAAVGFSVSSTLFETDLQLTLSTATPGAVIRYTTDLTVPTDEFGSESPEYTGPITIDASTQVRARAFLPGALPGPVRTETYLKMSGGLPTFSSDLPVVVISTLGGGSPPAPNVTNRLPAFIFIFEPDPVTGRTTLVGQPVIAERAGVRKRGSSSAGWPKYSMSLEVWDEVDGVDRNIEPLGLPREADWVLSARWEFDIALMRNPFMYALSNQVGRYAPRTRFVELYHDVSGEGLTDSDYFGVYTFIERIEADPNRVDVARIMPWDNAEPEITGGYVFKNDRGEGGMGVSGFSRLVPHDPGFDEMSSAQRNWLIAHLNEISPALAAADGVNPSTGLHFTQYLDVGSFIDNQLLNALSMDPDWGRLSQFFFLDRGGLVQAGPLWDYDRTMGSRDGRDDNPLRWEAPTTDTSFMWYDDEYQWFGRILGYSSMIFNGQTPAPGTSTRPDMLQRLIDRWYELRSGAFATANMHALIDSMAAEIAEAQVRNFAKWTQHPPGAPGNVGYSAPGLTGWEAEVSHLKGWLQARVDWIDSQFIAPPAFSDPGGVVIDPVLLTMTAPAGTIWYTTDGSDPRAPGGGVSGSAAHYTGAAVAVNQTQVVTARVLNGIGWGAPQRATYVLSDMAATSDKLAVSEVMYRPGQTTLAEEAQGFTDRDDFEYIEVINIHSSSVSLLGVQFDAGVTFDFGRGAITELAPGERVLVVRNTAAFEFRYGTAFSNRIAGEFENGTQLSNGGEQVRLSIPAGVGAIRDFTYNDKAPWPEAADGDGFSLVLIAPESNPDHTLASNWRSSVSPGGTPGAGDAVSFATWSAANGGVTAGSDGDMDMRTALREYAEGTDPGVADTSAGLMGVGSDLLEVGGFVDRYLTLALRRNLAADDVAMTPQSSLALGAWGDATAELVFVSETNHGDGTATLLYRSVVPIDQLPAAGYFLRVLLELR